MTHITFRDSRMVMEKSLLEIYDTCAKSFVILYIATLDHIELCKYCNRIH